MAEVAYLLGAGASAQCIPIVSDMALEINNIKDSLSENNKTIINNVSGDARRHIGEKVDRCMGILSKLAKVCQEHYSIDTYAKKLYLTNINDFNELKSELSFYFSLVQLLRPKDKRYDNFFASIINKKGTLPPKVKMISWNYDCQFELSYSQFNYGASLAVCRDNLKTVTPSDYQSYGNTYGSFSSIKLNGTAVFKGFNEYTYLITGDNRILETERLKDLYVKFNDLHNKFNETDLKFAWENSEFEGMFRMLKPDLAQIEVLVIVGYSFPFFNRDVDKRLFKNLPALKKIYIQDLNPENIQETMEEFVEFRKGGIRKIDVVHKTNLNQFVFPHELDITLD